MREERFCEGGEMETDPWMHGDRPQVLIRMPEKVRHVATDGIATRGGRSSRVNGFRGEQLA